MKFQTRERKRYKIAYTNMHNIRMCNSTDSIIINLYIIAQIAEWLRGYCCEQTNEAKSFGLGVNFFLSENAWRLRIRQAWLCGVLDRCMQLGKGNQRMSSMVFNTESQTLEER